MELKDFTIRHLAARIANDAIQLATIQAQLDVLNTQKKVVEKNEVALKGGVSNGDH